MPKINQEEYEVLKELDDKWKWIARDEDKSLWVFAEKPFRKSGVISSSCWDTEIGRSYPVLELIDEIHLFQFIQWEDENPYNIQELIEEYENDYKGSWEHAIEFSKEMRSESEETEVRSIKNIIEFIESDINLIEEKLPKMNREKSEGRKEWHEGYLTAMKEVQNKLGQLDEPEVLSDKWVDDNSVYASSDGITEEYVHVDDLKELLVPKQYEREQLEIAYKDILERGEFWFDDKKYKVVEKKTVEEEWVMEWLDNNDFYDHRTAETVLANAVDKGELGYYGTKYAVVEKPVIPQFVADILEENTFADLPTALEELFSANAGHYYGEDVCKWIVSNEETFARAWLDGYEAEEEPKYYVSARDEEYGGFWFLSKNNNGDISIGVNRDWSEVDWDRLKLTEQEIKDYDERYMVFAKPVEELE